MNTFLFFGTIIHGDIMKRSDVDLNKVTPMMKQYLEVKEANPDIILFFRLKLVFVNNLKIQKVLKESLKEMLFKLLHQEQLLIMIH